MATKLATDLKPGDVLPDPFDERTYAIAQVDDASNEFTRMVRVTFADGKQLVYAATQRLLVVNH